MLEFKKIEIEEIDFLQQLAEKIWKENYSKMISNKQMQYMLNLMYNSSLLKQEINSSEFIWNFICLENKKVGFFCCKRESEKLFLSKLYLDTTQQGKGIGQKTLLHIKQLAIEEHFSCIYLTVNKTNEKGIKSYEKFGFKNIKSMTFDIGNGFVMDDFIYEYSL